MKLNKKIYKQKKGITLVALVITIVVLLILAGISIAQLTGNGLFENAKLAKEKYENEKDLEDSTIQEYEDSINEVLNGSNRETVTIPKDEYDKLKNANNYTNDEIEIGTWTNGKTIYRKIIELESLQRGAEILIGTIEDIDCLIKSYGFSNDGTISASLPSRLTLIYKNGTSIYAYQDGNVYTNKPITIILEYTKLT